VDPYHLWHQFGGLYLAAYCHTRQAVHTFAIERIRQIAPCPETFARPADFNLEKYLEASFGLFRGKAVRIRLRFSPEVARYVQERQWHPSQRSAPLLTGELEVILHVAPEMDLKRWIMSYGKDVEILEPKKLRDEIRTEWLAALRGAGGRRERLTIGSGPSGRRPKGRTRAQDTGTGKRLLDPGAVAASEKS
jgi:predicted DNA-binding transcriptional regulator YafY